MRVGFSWTLLGSGLLAFCASHAAAAGAPRCPAVPAAPPSELSGWTGPVALAAAAENGNAAPRADLEIGRTALLALIPTVDARYPASPEKAGDTASLFTGIARFTVREAGTYRVALGSGAWVDIVPDGMVSNGNASNGGAIASVGHGHGPQCTGIRKMVDFPLSPGRYTLRIEASKEPQIRVLVAGLP